MKTLIVTTGNGQYLLKVWIPTLRQRGEYSGDILVLDYDFTPDVIRNLQKENVLLKKTKQIYPYFSNDRFRSFEECLKGLYHNYDIIMVIDSDVEFFKPIQPLFDSSQDKVCYVSERKLNLMWRKLVAIPNAEKYWEEIKTKPIINAGMFIGQAELIYKTVKFIADNVRYKSDYWGLDQILLNVFIYCFGIPSQKVDSTWNYVYKNYSTIGKVFDPNGDEIAILHKASL